MTKEEIQLVINEKLIDPRNVNGDPTPVLAANGTWYVPVRGVGEALDMDVQWESGAVYLTSRPKPIVIGTHDATWDDPFWTDESTGEYYSSENERRAAGIALAKVKAELGVDIEWEEYSSDMSRLLLQSVLAGQPCCDLAVLWDGIHGVILNQNVLQPLDPYLDKVFFGENAAERSWLLQGKTFGGYYLMNRDFDFIHTWPLVYNIDYIEAVPELKEADGTTLYPAELYERGEWTWSRFEDYLSKINDYYKGRWEVIGPYETNYSYAALAAAVSTGATLYDGENLNADSDEVIKAVEYLDRMIDSGLITCSTASENSINAGWVTGSIYFVNGQTVFTNCSPWYMDNAGEALGERGMSMGVIPFPKPDDKEDYSILSSSRDSVGLLRGIDSKRSELALEAYAMYKTEYYKALAGVDSMAEYVDAWAETEAINRGIDILHPEIGAANLRIFKEMAAAPINDYSESIGVFWKWADLVGKSVYGVGGAPEYPIALENDRNGDNRIYNEIEKLAAALKQDNAIDSVEPYVALVDIESFEFDRGTDPAVIPWSQYFTAYDNVDGDYEFMMENGEILVKGEDYGRENYFEAGRFTLDYSGVDFNTPGSYTIRTSLADRAWNVCEKEFEIVIR